MKVLITGAHFTPAIAVSNELKKKKDIEIVYVGRKTTQEGDKTKSAESQIIPNLGIKFISITTGRLQRRFTLYTIPSLLKIPIGFIQAILILLNEKPDVILSFGGYVSVPIVVIGWFLSVPVVLHEQTIVSGLANKICSLFANKICVGFKNHDFAISKEAIFTGNPIRKEILEPEMKLDQDYKDLFNEAKKSGLPVVYITGGNQGSHIINETLEKIIDRLTKIACIIHQTGDSKLKDFDKLAVKQNERYLPKKWVNKEIGYILEKSDLVVSRAGANTLMEMAYFSKIGLVIPLPFLFGDEQNKNAHFFEKFGLVKILPQYQVNENKLFDEINYMLKNIDILNKKIDKQGLKQVVVVDSDKRIALEVILTHEKNKV